MRLMVMMMVLMWKITTENEEMRGAKRFFMCRVRRKECKTPLTSNDCYDHAPLQALRSLRRKCTLS